jgi:hypothetical protein
MPPIKATKAERAAIAAQRKADRQAAWTTWLARAGPFDRVVFLPREIRGMESCLELRGVPAPDETCFPASYLVNDELLSPIEDQYLLLVGQEVQHCVTPPKISSPTTRGQYVLTGPEGLKIHFLPRLATPMLTSETVADLAARLGRTVARPGQNVVFREREPISDVEDTDVSYYVLPSMWSGGECLPPCPPCH